MERSRHIARMKGNRWTERCTEWQPRRGKRARERPSRSWQDDKAMKEGTTWNRKKATDGGQWKAIMEGNILQWIDKACVKGEKGRLEHQAFHGQFTLASQHTERCIRAPPLLAGVSESLPWMILCCSDCMQAIPDLGTV